MHQTDSLKKEINKKLLAKADTLVTKTLSCPRIKLSNSQTLILDVVETGVLLSNFAQQLLRKNADVPDVYFTLLDASCISPTLVLNENATAKEGGNWAPFKIRTSEAAKIVYAGWCYFWLYAQISGS